MSSDSALFPPSTHFDELRPEAALPVAAASAAKAKVRAAKAKARAHDAELDRAATFAFEWAALAMVLVCAAIVVGVALWQMHGSVDAAERERLNAQARVVDENVAQQLDGINRALKNVRDEFLESAPGSVSTLMSSRLKALTDAIPGVRSMVLLDADGNVAATSVDTLLGRNFSDRDYARTARSRRDPATLHVAAPYQTSLGNYAIVFSRAVVAADGTFAGTAAAALEPEYFEVLMRSVLYAPDMWVSLGHADGKVFVTMPRSPARLESHWQAGLTDAAGRERSGQPLLTVRGPAGGGGEVRMTALRELAPSQLRMDKPLVIAVSRSEAAVFVGWRRQAIEYAGFYVLLCAVAGFGLWRGHTRRTAFARLEADAARERRAQSDQLALALQSADLGLWHWDLTTDRFSGTELARQHLGYGAGELGDAPPADWRQRVHRADAAGLTAAVEAHCSGDAAALECEFRVRHKDGHWVWLLSRGKIVERDEAGAPVRMSGTYMDIGERKRNEARLERSAEMLRRTGELALIGGWELDLETHRVDWTDEVFRIHELEPGPMPELERAIGFYAAEAQPLIAQAVAEGAASGTPWDLELPFVTAKGNPRWVRAQGRAVVEDGRIVRLQGAFQDITERKTTALELHRLNEQLQRLSTTDALTEVGNRRLFDQTLHTEWQRAARRGEPVGLLMIDIDHFKEYNDHYGHPAGDACLRQVARMVGEAMRRGGELVARYGGEEFALLLPGADLAQTLAAAGRCGQLLAEAKVEHRASPVSAWVTVSIGAASQNASPRVAASTLIDIADAALYRAKRCGRGRIEW